MENWRPSWGQVTSPDELPEIDIHKLLPLSDARHQESCRAAGLEETPHHARKTLLKDAGRRSVNGFSWPGRPGPQPTSQSSA